MSISKEDFKKITKLLNREPDLLEIEMFAAMWSEHCSYRRSKKDLQKFPTEADHVIQGPGEGAGIVDIGDGLAIAFKIESHNHPSAVDPFQGAATGVGGIVRDIFSMGARPIALMNSLRFGNLNNDRTKFLFENVVAGISHYGNCIGVPTVGGEICFDDSYEGNPLVNAMCVGLIKHEDIKKSAAKGPGNSVIYVGARTGKDGIHGAVFASDELEDDADKTSIQVGDPFLEKLLIEATLEAAKHPAVLSIQDMGAAGLTCAASEMAHKGEVGITLNLDLVPLRNSKMNPYEIMLSESQERMLFIIQEGFEDEIKEIFNKWDLEAEKIGEVIEEKNIRVLHGGKSIADIPVDALCGEVQLIETVLDYTPPAIKETQRYNIDPLLALKKILALPTIASKRWVKRQYDHHVQTNTIHCENDAAVIRIRGTNKAIAMSTDCNSSYLLLDPEEGGKIAVAESIRNIVASGARPLALTNCLNFGNPEKNEIFYQFRKATDGMSQACRVLKTPVIGGNVSFYNESTKGAINPTPVIGTVGLIDDIEKIPQNKFIRSGDTIYLIGNTHDDFGGSALQKITHDRVAGQCPRIELGLESLVMEYILDRINIKVIDTVKDVSDGGVIVAICEMLFGTSLGVELSLDRSDIITELFSESQSRYIVAVTPEEEHNICNFTYSRKIGKVNDSRKIKVEKVFDIDVHLLYNIWNKSLERFLQ